ncbi:MAG: hypothetical protein ABI321_14525 [Polyangia bacterium]
MELLFLAIAASVSAASLMLWSQARRVQKPKALLPASVDRTPLTLQVGDIVTHLDRDFLVEGALLLSENPRAARLCRLIDGSTERFLYATSANDEAWLLEEATTLPEGRPELVRSPEALRVERRWRAAALTVGRIGKRTFDADVQVYEYVGGDKLLLLLDGPARSVGFVGLRLLPHAVDILPGRG